MWGEAMETKESLSDSKQFYKDNCISTETPLASLKSLMNSYCCDLCYGKHENLIDQCPTEIIKNIYSYLDENIDTLITMKDENIIGIDKCAGDKESYFIIWYKHKTDANLYFQTIFYIRYGYG